MKLLKTRLCSRMQNDMHTLLHILISQHLGARNLKISLIWHDVGVKATDDDNQLLCSVEQEVEETSKALELPDLDAKDSSDYGSDFEFS